MSETQTASMAAASYKNRLRPLIRRSSHGKSTFEAITADVAIDSALTREVWASFWPSQSPS
jgi:hypothetical protein